MGGGGGGGGALECDLDLQPTQANISNGTSTPQGEHLCKIILKLCKHVEVMEGQAQFKIILSFHLQVLP